ncbi:STAS domain-containing protein [Lentzea tibetensis]|uniref:Anti-sigma factor antagonist n=1 Tax=Lentzea tibetensis TaxID=2591470 RepID=A0A563EGQ0_9PSEU|nr:STAS domain-containing protein [Lentzea tibetensis]TWP45621.1 STAS domain-containing protein [Lentzea tibetensis]
MTTVLQHLSTDRIPGATAVRPALHPCAELVTVTARPVLPGAIVLAVRGEVDSSTSQQLQDGLLAHLRPTGPPLVIDLTDVTFLGAAGLTVLVNVSEAAVAARVGLCVVACARSVLLPLRITGLDELFDIHPDITHALLRLGDGPDG